MKNYEIASKSSKIVKLLSSLGLIALAIGAAGQLSYADDTLETKVKNGTEDAKTSTKKNVRKAKRSMRKATGNDNVVKDAKDAVNDAGDDIKGSASKLNNKVKE